MAETGQNYGNHVRWVKGFHFFVLPVLALNLVAAVIHMVATAFRFQGVASVLTAIALIVLAFYARIFALKAQDRVIRLEERLRMERLLPDDLRPRIGEFRTAQIVALRFASDAELPALARKVLADGIVEQKAIKQMVKEWRGDYLRV